MDCSILVEKVRKSIALVVTLNEKGKLDGKGSGFIFWKKGILVTCNHVVVGSPTIKIKFPDQEIFIDAKLAIADTEHDLALLKFDDNTRDPLVAADIKTVKEGIPVVFAGYPLSLFDLTTHQGTLSAIIKDATGLITYLIDGTVNGGNSGCPLMNNTGEVIGVVNAKRREHTDILTQVEEMGSGAISLHGVDLVKIYQALIENVQLGIGYAVPCSYIPPHHDPEIEGGRGDGVPPSVKEPKKIR